MSMTSDGLALESAINIQLLLLYKGEETITIEKHPLEALII